MKHVFLLFLFWVLITSNQSRAQAPVFPSLKCDSIFKRNQALYRELSKDVSPLYGGSLYNSLSPAEHIKYDSHDKSLDSLSKIINGDGWYKTYSNSDKRSDMTKICVYCCQLYKYGSSLSPLIAKQYARNLIKAVSEVRDNNSTESKAGLCLEIYIINLDKMAVAERNIETAQLRASILKECDVTSLFLMSERYNSSVIPNPSTNPLTKDFYSFTKRYGEEVADFYGTLFYYLSPKKAVKNKEPISRQVQASPNR